MKQRFVESSKVTAAYYYDESVARLQVLLEEVTRAKPGTPETRFVQSDSGTLDRLASRFHHVLYGRRGAGKSSLLRHIESEHRKNGNLVAWTDQETYQGLTYPDVLLSTLEEVFLQFGMQLRKETPDVTGVERLKFWKPKDSKQELADVLGGVVAQLRTLKAAPSEAEVEWTASTSRSVGLDTSTGGSLTGAFKGLRAGLGFKRSRSTTEASGQDVLSRYKTRKSEHLERVVPTYRDLMKRSAAEVSGAFVVLDDFYRLAEEDQARIAGYFHRVVKDTNVWLKIGSIRYWTRLYAGGSPAIGVQAPHDIRELSLDRGMLDFKSSKRFLEEILTALTSEAGVDVEALFSDGALDRLVLASGGVPRDYIGLISEAIAVAKNRGPSNKEGTHRVIAEDINEAAGRTVETKFADLEVDAGDQAQALRELVVEITNHCRRTKSACFLVDFRDDALIGELNRLQNMRFVHALDMNESLPDPQSSRYNVYLLDVSQLAAQRAWQVDFMGWQKREKRRARKLVFRPHEDVEAAETSTGAGGAVPEDDGAEGEQLSLDDSFAVVGDVDPPNEPPL